MNTLMSNGTSLFADKGIVRKALISCALLAMMLFVLSGCGHVRSAKDLYSEAVRTYGECEIISQTENEEHTVLVLRDKLQGFEYTISSGMNDIMIDGSSFGSVENTGSTFHKALCDYVFSQCMDELEEICENYGAVCDTQDIYFFRIGAKNAKDAENAALACAEVLQSYNLNGRMDNWEMPCYRYEGESFYNSDRFGSVKLPNIEWISREQEKTNYYIEMAHYQTDSNAQFLRKEEGTFADTGADLNRVVSELGSDYPTEGTSPVMFYYFRASDGTEYFMCDFNYYDDDHYEYQWYTNYFDVVPDAKKQ
jgi:hypothetical protein